MLKKLPVGIFSFDSLIKENYIYVDKTRFIYQLVTESKFYFLSRPRRFGKSLLVSTLKCLFEGRKELFQGLWIAAQSDWAWQQYPIITFDFNGIPHDTPEKLDFYLFTHLQKIAQQHGLLIDTTDKTILFKELILALAEKTGQPVVILIDEYDKPIIEHLGHGPTRLALGQMSRDILRHFFGVLKDIQVGPALRFVFLTGVSRFSRMSIFSELNHLRDISMNEYYAEMLGYTQSELEQYFQPYLTALAEKYSLSLEQLMAKLAYYYNGYRFSRKEIRIYNPFSILNVLLDQQFENYWFSTGTATFLVNLLREQQYNLSQIEGVQVDASTFNSFDLENLSPEAILFQTGYLTIRDVEESDYILDFPNQEVKVSLTKSLLLGNGNLPVRYSSLILKLNRYLGQEKLSEFFQTMQAIYAAIPYDIQTKRDEAYYHTVFYLIMSASGAEARSSLLTSLGRIDLAILFQDKVYIFEFKCNQRAAVALAQIKTQQYARQFQAEGVKIILIGLNFNPDTRNIDEWEIESLT